MNKYQRTLPSTTVDVYDILQAYEVKSHALGHAIKKLLMAGQRGHKDYQQDLREAVQAIEREIAMSGKGSDEKRAVGGSGVVSVVDYTDGEWHEWHGGECPVQSWVHVIFRSGSETQGYEHDFSWNHRQGNGDIIRFKVVK